MKRKLLIYIIVLMFSFTGCKKNTSSVQVVATTLPIYTFCEALCEGTAISVGQLIQDNVSCLHDYTLQVNQMQKIEGAEIVVINGAGLEEFLDDALASANFIIDSSAEIEAICHEHEHADSDHHAHNHDQDPHFWLSPTIAKQMVQIIYEGLCSFYPEHTEVFNENLTGLLLKLDALQRYGERELSKLKTNDLITFHDGFSYFAESFNLHILRAIEEDAGSETSAAQLIELIEQINAHQIPAIFTEKNGSTASAQIITAETGVKSYVLDMAISQGDYFEIMYQNIDTVKEALG